MIGLKECRPRSLCSHRSSLFPEKGLIDKTRYLLSKCLFLEIAAVMSPAASSHRGLTVIFVVYSPISNARQIVFTAFSCIFVVNSLSGPGDQETGGNHKRKPQPPEARGGKNENRKCRGGPCPKTTTVVEGIPSRCFFSTCVAPTKANS